MAGKAIASVFGIQSDHQGIAGGFG